MDFNDQNWHMRLTATNGDAISIGPEKLGVLFQQVVIRLRAAQLRKGKGGHKGFTLDFSTDRNFSDNIMGHGGGMQLAEIPNDASDGPQDGEDWDAYYFRLQAEGFSQEIAAWFANDWFEIPQDEHTQRWMTDPKVQRFHELQISRSAYEAAGPGEYEELKRFIETEFPERAAILTFRTA